MKYFLKPRGLIAPRSSLILVCTVCSDLSVPILRIFMVAQCVAVTVFAILPCKFQSFSAKCEITFDNHNPLEQEVF